MKRDPIYFSKISSFFLYHFSKWLLLLSNSYIIENDVCYLVLCDRQFSKKLAYSFLEEIAQEFDNNYGRRVSSVTRPYAFIEFDIYIQKARKGLTDRRRNINSINTQLQDVQRIMVSDFLFSITFKLIIDRFQVQNIDDVLARGAVLSELDTKTQNLSMLSAKYKKDATYLNRKSMYVKAAAAGIVFLVFIFYFWVL